MLRANGRSTNSRRPGEMFFTPLGLEQATDEWVAAFKAARFTGRVLDLCTGIGGDYLALAARGPCTAVDRDDVMAILAAANLRSLRRGQRRAANHAQKCAVADVRAIDTQEFEAWHIDPDRRPSGRRTTHVGLARAAARGNRCSASANPNAAIKLAPAARMTATLARRGRVGVDQSRPIVPATGGLVRQSGARRRQATRHGALRSIAAAQRGRERAPKSPPVADAIERFLFEPDAAVLAAGLEGVLATEHFVASIAPGVAYWTGSQPITDPALACFEVREVLPLRVKTIQSLAAIARRRATGNQEAWRRARPRRCCAGS